MNWDPPSPRRNRHRCYHSRPMPSITVNLKTIKGGPGAWRAPSSLKILSFFPHPVPSTRGGTRYLFNTAKDPIEGILLADAITEAAKSNKLLTDDEWSEFKGDHSDFLLSLPSANRSGWASDKGSAASPLSKPSSNMCHQTKTTLTTMRRRLSFRPWQPSADSANILGDPWDAFRGHAPSSSSSGAAAQQEGLNKRVFLGSLSVPSLAELATSVPKYSPPNASNPDTDRPLSAVA